MDLGNKELDPQFLEALLRGQIHNLTILRNRIRIKHALIRSLDLRNAKVPYSVSLSDCVFETEVILENAVFEQDVGFESSKFKKGADFINVNVRGTVSVDGARFDGPADFESARVGHDLFAVGAVFKTNADFADIHVDGLADFDGAGFDGPVDFTGGKIGESLLVRKAIYSTMDFSSGQFESQKKDAVTLCAAMGSAAEVRAGRDSCIQWLNEQLERPDLFDQISAPKPGLTLPGGMEELRTKTQDSRRHPFKDLSADAKEEIKRLNRLTIELRWPMEAPKKSEAIFRANALVTGLDLNLDGAVFDGPVHFDSSKVGLALVAREAKFYGRADFPNIVVHANANFYSAEFEGPVDFSGSKVGGDFIARARFEGYTNFDSLQVDGIAHLYDARFGRPVSIVGAKIVGGFLAMRAAFSSPVAFSDGEFAHESMDPLKLCAAMGSAPGIQAGQDACVQWLNEQLERPDLFEQITAAKSGLTLPAGMEELRTKTQETRKRPFKDLNADQKEEIKRLNRRTIELRWPEAAPRRTYALDATGLVTGVNLLLNNATFDGPATFNIARVGRVLSAVEARFKEETDFSYMHVDENANFYGAGFYGPSKFGAAEVRADLSAVNAVFVGDTDFSYMHVDGNADFYKAGFYGPAKFSEAKVGRIFSAAEAKFEGDADFSVIHVVESADFYKSEFNGPVKFSVAQVGADLSAAGAVFKAEADFSYIHVDGNTNFYETAFNGPMKFSEANVGRILSAVEARFKEEANFAFIHVAGYARFDGAEFNGPVDFTGGKIEGSLLARKAIVSGLDFSSGQFTSEKKDPLKLCAAMGSAADLKAGQDACIQWLDEQLKRPDLFDEITGAKPGLALPGEIEALRTSTQDVRKRPFKDLNANAKEEIKKLNRLTIELRWPMEAPKRSEASFRATALVTGQDLNLDGAVFDWRMGFNSAKVGRILTAVEATFKSDADFSYIHVNINAVLRGAEFDGPIDFSEAEIDADLSAAAAGFGGVADFTYVHVGRDALFTGLIVESPDTSSKSEDCQAANMKFDKADIKGDFTFSNKIVPGRVQPRCRQVSLENAQIGRKLQIYGVDRLEFRLNGLSYRELRVAPLQSPHGKSSGVINDIYVPVKNFIFKPPFPPEPKPLETVQINEDNEQDHDRCGDSGLEPYFKFLGSSNFNFQNYVQLESYFKSVGKEECADKAYIHGMHLQNLEKNYGWYQFTLVFWDGLAGYGRRPDRIFLCAFLFFVFGMIAFNPKYLDDDFRKRLGCPDSEDPLIILPSRWAGGVRSVTRCALNTLTSIAVRVGLSLDIFVPTHHPVYVDHWRRSEVPTRVMVYYYIHRAVGMILVAIGAAALFTHLKMNMGG